VLRFGQVVVMVTETNPRVEIGRQKSNDIQVLNNRVSRSHAMIERRHGKYYLIDQSSNGTYLLMEGNQGIALRKREICLADRGVIGPGYKVDGSSPEGIHFQLETIR
jgi:pSer/pThr/pTyr-binding forkhead associated (FHA) protein